MAMSGLVAEPARWRSCQSRRQRKLRFAGPLQSPLPDSNPRPPPYHGTTQATGRKPRQRFSLVGAVFAPVRFATDCHRLQPRGSIKAPSFVVLAGYMALAAPAVRRTSGARHVRHPRSAVEPLCRSGVAGCSTPPTGVGSFGSPKTREDGQPKSTPRTWSPHE